MKSKSRLTKHINPQSILVLSLLITNGLNFIYNAFLGKTLTIENFGLVTFINTLLYIVTIVASAFASTATHRTGFLATNMSKSASYTFLYFIQKKTVYISIFIAIMWMLLLPFIATFFHVSEVQSLVFFTPVLLSLFIAANNRGFLMGNTFFVFAAILFLSEALSKLLIAGLLVYANVSQFAYLSIPLSICVSFFLSVLFIHKVSKKLTLAKKNTYLFPKRFFAAALVTGIATTGFLSLDIILVKHFFNSTIAGEYSLLSLAGKMIFFFGSLVNTFIITYTSRDLGKNKNPNNTFYKLLLISFVLSLIGYLCVGILGFSYFPAVFGQKVLPIIQYLPLYGLAILFFTLSNTFTLYHLTRHHFSFSLLAMLTFLGMVIGIYNFHKTILDIVYVLLVTSFANLILAITLHILKRNGKFILRNIVDLLDLFTHNHPYKKNKSKRNILIFNWRDTKHSFAGGAEVYIHELAKRWVEKGHHVTVFCGRDGSSKRTEIIDGVHIVRRGGFYFVYIWAIFYYLVHFRGKYDVIIDTQNGIPFFTPLYAKEKVYCLMFHVHQEVFFRSLSKPLATIASILENRVMPWAYKKVQFITISQSTKKEMKALDLGKAGITILSPGINRNIYFPLKKQKRPLVAYVGRLQFYKSIHVFIHAAHMVLKKLPGIQFIVVGDGEEKEKLEQLATHLQIDKNIQFLGKVAEQKKIDLYQKAWVVVNPSYKEGWGITTIEANACATPVVASNVAGLRDSVNNPHTGYLVEYGNAKAFAEKIETLLVNKETRERMEKEAVRWARKFDWDICANKGMRLII